ncbi:MAG: TIR domain-containing protein, partial [Cyclobacteriaceae bacterium]
MPQYDAFISYNSRETNQVHRVAEWLREQGVQVFLDKWELRPGDKLVKTLGEALAESDCCVVMIGENGISPWHENEIYSVLDATIDRTMKRGIPVFLPGTNPPAKKTELPWFLRGILYVTFEGSVEEKDRLQEIKFGITGLHENGQAAAGECPYRGLEVFREEDRKYFYGREALVQQLCSRLEDLDNNRLLAVLGPSGSGKSSVVRAGLIPQLENEKTLITVFTPGNNPIEQLSYALRGLSDPRPNVEDLKHRLDHSKEALHLISGELTRDLNREKVVLIVDQFEELFTLTQKEAWVQHFIDLLIYAVEVADGSTHVILTMRSDFLGRCAKFTQLNDYMSHHMEQVGPMNVQELRDAIEQPAWKAGLTFEAGLVDSLLKDVKNAPGKLPLLQFALKELYNQRDGNQLTHQTYQAL